MEQSRKTLIADTAIALLGTLGARGLTHRAVDAEAGLPAGSTSFYCRSRIELLRLALLRHAALDLADLAQDAGRLDRPAWSPTDLLDLLEHRLDDWLQPGKRARLVARFELFLVASREPELATILQGQRQHFLQAAVAALHRAGVARAETVAPMLVMALDGLLLDRVREQGPSRPAAEHRDMLERIIAG